MISTLPRQTTPGENGVRDDVRDRLARAEAVLASLLEARGECERQLAAMRRADPIKAITGQSAIERAIDSTRSMIESLERVAVEVEGRGVGCRHLS